MKNATIDMETAVKNFQTGIKSLGITMQEVSEGLQRSAKYISSEQALKSVTAHFKNANYDLIKGLSN